MDPRSQLRVAEGYLELGMRDDARREFEQLQPEDRLMPEALQLNVQIHLHEGAWEAALALSRQLCDVAPPANAGYIHAAYCLHELGRTEEARNLLLDGPESLREEPVFFYNLGCYEARLGETDSARAWLLRSFELDETLRHQAKSDPDLVSVWEAETGSL